MVSWVFLRSSGRSGCSRSYAKREGFPKIDAAHFRIPGQRLRTAGTKNPAVVNNIRAIGHGQRLAHVMICDQNSDTAAFEIEDDSLEFQHLNGIYAAEGFVQQQKAGIDYQRARDLHAP